MATPLTVYPNAKYVSGVLTSLTVYAADEVTLIPQDGASVDYELQYYKNALASGELVTASPFLPLGPPIDLVIPTVAIVGGPGTAGQVLALVTPSTGQWEDNAGGIADGTIGLLSQVDFTSPGSVDRVKVRTAGAFADGDGGEDDYRWYLGDTTAVDGGRVFADTGNTGRWKSLSTRCDVKIEQWTGALAGQDITAAFINCLQYCQPWVTRLHFGSGSFRTTQPIRCAQYCPGIKLIGTQHGNSSGGSSVSAPQTIWIWDGASYIHGVSTKEPMVHLTLQDHLEGFIMWCVAGKACYEAISYNNYPATGTVVLTATGSSVTNVIVYGLNGGGEPRGDFYRGLGVGEGQLGSCDFLSCTYFTCANLERGIDIAGGQPYGINLKHCGMINVQRAVDEGYGQASAAPSGRNYGGNFGRWIDFSVLSTNLTLDDCSFSYIETGISLTRPGVGGGGDPVFITITNSDSEWMKHLFRTTTAQFNNGSCVLQVVGGRWACAPNTPSQNDPDGTDNYFIQQYYGGSIYWKGNCIPADVNDAKMAVGVSTLVDIGANWPGTDPVVRRAASGQQDSGGTYCHYRANRDVTSNSDGESFVHYVTNGCENPPGEILGSGVFTSIPVKLKRPETRDNYRVTFGQPVAIGGTPSAGSLQVPTILAGSQTKNGFTLVPGAAAGTSADIVRYPFNIELGAARGFELAASGAEVITTAAARRGVATVCPGNAAGFFFAHLAHYPIGGLSANFQTAMERGFTGSLGYAHLANVVSFQSWINGTALSHAWDNTRDSDTLQLFVTVYTGTEAILYGLGGVELARATCSFTPNGSELCFASQAGLLPTTGRNCTEYQIMGGLYGEVVGGITQAEVRVLFDQVKASRRMEAGALRSGLLLATNGWRFNGEATVPDFIGSANVTMTSGTLADVTAVGLVGRAAW